MVAKVKIPVIIPRLLLVKEIGAKDFNHSLFQVLSNTFVSVFYLFSNQA
jgi:hypothetical protein